MKKWIVCSMLALCAHLVSFSAFAKDKPVTDAEVIFVLLDHQIQGVIFVATNGKIAIVSADDCDSVCYTELKKLHDAGRYDVVSLDSHPST